MVAAQIPFQEIVRLFAFRQSFILCSHFIYKMSHNSALGFGKIK